MSKKLLISLASGKTEPERATVALNIACVSASSGVETTVFFTAEGATLSVKNGVADEIAVDGMPAFKDLLETFFEAGGKGIVCTPCFMKRGYKQEDLHEGCMLAGAATVVEILTNGAASLSF